MCIDDAMILKLLADELPEDQREAVRAHLAACPACRDLHDSLRRTWEQLGQLDLPVPAVDLTADVLAGARREMARGRLFARGSIAAAILLAGGIGWAAGRLVPTAGQVAPPISTEQMAQGIGLDALGGDVGALSVVFSDESEADSAPGGRS